jgi:ribonuclease HII
VGVDEAGRGALAGPIVACAVGLKPSFTFHNIVNDSKKINETNRKLIFNLIQPHIHLGIGMSTHRLIDKYNVLNATLIAMQKAIRRVPLQPFKVIIDGHITPKVTVPCTSKVKADTTVIEVMAASICAKVIRDHIMVKYHHIYPLYSFKKHKGYGTKDHYNQLFKHGQCPIHRLTFNLHQQLSLF